MNLVGNLPQAVTAIGGLGAAAFGLVDASKVLWGGVNHIGFPGIRKAVSPLIPTTGLPANAMPQDKLFATLKANWMNGTDLASQKSIAKSLIKLTLNAANAHLAADATGLDPAVLTSVATKIASGDALNATESDVFGRFDLLVTALLDEAYQRGDQVYRNWTRALAAAVAVGLAFAGERALHVTGGNGVALLVGLLATPLAPIAKDLSTALATAVNSMQLVKR